MVIYGCINIYFAHTMGTYDTACTIIAYCKFLRQLLLTWHNGYNIFSVLVVDFHAVSC